MCKRRERRINMSDTIQVKDKLEAMNQSDVGKIHPAITFVDGKLTIQLQVGHPSQPDAITGCFPTHAIEALIKLHEFYNTQIPSHETSMAILKLREAWLWLNARKLDRESRGVLQTDKK